MEEAIFNEQTGYFETKKGELFISQGCLMKLNQTINTCVSNGIKARLTFQENGLIVEVDPKNKTMIISHPVDKYQKELKEVLPNFKENE